MQTSIAKKIFAVGVAASTVLMSLAPFAAQAAAHVNGTNIKTSDGTVYMVIEGQRRPYTSAGAFLSYGFNSWSQVVDANADDLALPVGSFIPPQDGKIICSDRGSDKGTCYLITAGQKAGFTSAAVFTGLGFSFARSQFGDVSWMSSTTNIDNTTAAHRPGVLVNTNGTVYLMGATGLLGIPDVATFNGWGYSFSDVVMSNAADKALTQTGVMASRTSGQLSPTALTSTPSTPTIGGGLSVGLASTNPVSSVLADGTANNVVLRANLSAGSAPVSVTGIKFTKTGYTANTNITGVAVYVNGTRHGNVISTLGADGVAVTTFSSKPVTVPAYSSAVVELRINISTSANSGTIGFNVNSAADITSNASSVSGTFPVVGNVFTTVDGSSSLAAVTLDVQAVNASGVTYNVNSVDSQRVTKFRVVETTSNEKINVHSLILWNNGTAADGDLKDIQLRDQTGVVLATAQQVGKEVVFNLTTPYVIDKGQTKDFEVWAKIIGGAARTIQFTVYNDYDLYVTGSNTVSGILPTAAGGVDSTFPIGDASTYNTVTIGSGSLVFNRASDSPSSAMVPGATEQVLAKYDLTPQGEDMEIRTVSFGIATGAVTQSITGTVYVKVDGAVVYSAAHNATNFTPGGTVASRTLSSYPVIKAGVKSVVEIIASVHTTVVSGSSLLVNDFDVTSVKRLITNDIVDPAVSPLDGLTRNITDAALAVRTLSTPVASTLIPVTTGVELGHFELDASASSEDVNVATVVVTDTTGTTATMASIANLQMFKKNSDGSLTLLQTSASTATLSYSSGTGIATFNFSASVLVTKGTKVTLVLKGDLISGSSPHTHTFNIASGGVTATGATTGNGITETYSGSGQARTVAAGGTLTGSLLTGTGATPSVAQVVNVGTQDGTYFGFRLNAQYEAQKITSLTLTATGTALTANNLINLDLYRKVGSVMDTTPFAQASGLTCTSNVCSFTWTHSDNLLPAPIEPGSPVEVYVKADIGGEGVAKLGNDFYLGLNMTSGTSITGKGVTTGNAPTYAGGLLQSTTGITYVVPFSVVVATDYPTNGSTVNSSVGANTIVGRFKVTNNGSAQITLTNATFTDSGSNSTTADRYSLLYSTQNSNDYTTNTATSAASTVGYGALTNTFTIDGGAYRYLSNTVSAGTGGLSVGDSFTLAVASLGNLTYSVTEASLGFDGNQDGDLGDTVTGLYVDGKPAAGTVYKSN